MENHEKMETKTCKGVSGMNYAPKGKPAPVVGPGEFVIAAIALDHGHIYGMCNGLVEAGATLKWVYDPDPKKVAAFLEQFPDAREASGEEEILSDPEVRLVCGAAVTSLRCALGLRVMAAGKDYFTDKAPLTTLKQLEQAREMAARTGRKYMVYYSERIHSEAAVFAGMLIEQGAIGRPIHVDGFGPHRVGEPKSRPDWFFEKEKYGGILCDIGSHQIEQFLYYCNVKDARVEYSQVGNYGHPDYPELEDFGDAVLVGDNGATQHFRVDWFTPDGLSTWGDGRTFILGTDGYIELRKYVNVGTLDGTDNHVFLVNREGEQHFAVSGKVGYPFFGQLILDCINRTENAMTQEHAFKAAELCVKAELAAVNRTEKKRLNVAVVGCGNIAHAHVEGLLTFPERCKIVALCDIYPEKAEAMREKYGLDCRIYDDHEKMLSSGLPIDLVHVCTPPYVHAPIAINAMNAGCHVTVEKPMAASLAECDAMLEAERRNRVTMACIAQNRFRNSIYKLKKTADSGLAGRICCTHVDSLWWRGHCYYDLWWRGTWEKEGGGPTLNHAVHHIDMLNWIKGSLPEEVTAILTNVAHDNSEVEDLSLACLRYADGSVASVTSSVVHHGEEQGIVLQCERAKLSAPWSVAAEISQDNGFPRPEGNRELKEELDAYYSSIPDLKYEGHTGEIDDILSALEEGRRPLITGQDGRRTVELISAIYKAGCTRSVVTLPIEKDDDYYTFQGILKHAIRFHEKTASVENFREEGISLGNY